MLEDIVEIWRGWARAERVETLQATRIREVQLFGDTVTWGLRSFRCHCHWQLLPCDSHQLPSYASHLPKLALPLGPHNSSNEQVSYQ